MQLLRDLSVRTKLFAGFVIVLILSLVLGVVLISKMGAVNAGGAYIATNSVPSIEVIDQIQGDEQAYRADQLWNITNTDLALSAAPINGLKAANSQIEADFQRYTSMTSNATDAHLLATARSQWAAYVAATPRLNLAISHVPEADSRAGELIGADVRAARADDQELDLPERRALQEQGREQRVDVQLITIAGNHPAGGGARRRVLDRLPDHTDLQEGTDEMLRAADAIADGDVDQQITLILSRMTARPDRRRVHADDPLPPRSRLRWRRRLAPGQT